MDIVSSNIARAREAAAMTEREFAAQVVELALALDWTVFRTWRSDHSPAGEPDLRMCRPPRYIVAELKTQRGKLTPLQEQAFMLLSQCRGIETYVWRPSQLEEIAEVLR